MMKSYCKMLLTTFKKIRDEQIRDKQNRDKQGLPVYYIFLMKICLSLTIAVLEIFGLI